MLFRQVYSPLFRSKSSLRYLAPVRAEFTTEAAKSLKSGSGATTCSRLQSWHPAICLACLMGYPSNDLTCGHRLCDACVLRNLRSDVLPQCPLCFWPNSAPLRPKPPAAGIRVLRLAGDDPRAIAALLKELRRRLLAPLQHYFDLLLCSGVGIYFGVMMFCQGASVEDCLHHVDKLQPVRMTRSGLTFGPRLKFTFSELQETQVKMVFCVGDRIMTSYR